MKKFSTRSLKELETCHEDLQEIMKKALELTVIDFGISEGYRTRKRQNLLYKQGKSKVDGIKTLGKHNHNPSMAVDIYAWVGGKASWEDEHLCYLGGLIIGVYKILYYRRAIRYHLRWGGNWDNTGDIGRGFKDLPHFKLISKNVYQT